MPKGGRIVSALEQLKREADYLEWVKGTKAVTPEGNPLTVYHGTNRLDRLVDKIRPERSTSGPMPFFTANPDIASNYAKGKTDNSIEDAGYEHWFQYRPKGSRSDQPLDRLWWDMTPEQQKTFHERMPNIREDDEREHVLHDPEGGMAGPGTYEQYLREQRGNGLAAARELWLSSGVIFNDEHKFMDVLREAGAPLDNVTFTDFNHGAPGVMPAHLAVKNPLVTSDIPPHVVEALDEASSRVRKPTRAFQSGADPWDKSIRNPDDWMQALKTDLEEGTQLAWTSIPDWVTRTLKGLGYDGIHDSGGKLGGEKHDVWVPFDPEQVRSSITKKARGGRVGFAKGGKVARTAMDELKEYANALAPQKGMFSTLDKLIEQAPFDKGSAEQWRNYLKPGRTFEREGVQFPLKKEELEYALDPALKTEINPELRDLLGVPVKKEELLDQIRKNRPEFRVLFSGPEKDSYKTALQLGNEKQGMGAEGRAEFAYPSYGPERDPRLSHQSPGSVYEESGTILKDLNYLNHFTPDTMSWARTSSHELPSGEKMRLIEEIQSDLHQNAAEKMWDLDTQNGRREALKQSGLWKEYADLDEELARINNERLQKDMRGDHDEIFELGKQEDALREKKQELVDRLPSLNPRRGYLTDEDRHKIKVLQRAGVSQGRPDLLNKPPDAPFKDPREYAALEMKKQLLNAAHNDEDYLALTRGSDQRERYGGAGEGTEYFYDQLYPSEMAKLAKKYGAEMTEVEAPLGSAMDTRVQNLRDLGLETSHDIRDFFGEGDAFIRPGSHHENAIDTIQSVAKQLDPENEHNWKRLVDYVRTNAVTEQLDDPKYSGDIADAWDELVTRVIGMHEQRRLESEGTKEVKTFPAIKLTPEVRERIKKAGVSLWATGAGAAGLEMLGHPDDASAEETGPATTGGGFAEGGTVNRLLGDLKHAALTLGSQIMPYNSETGSFIPAVPRKTFSGKWIDENGKPLTEEEAQERFKQREKATVGLYEETKSIPATFGGGPKFAQDAAERQEDFVSGLRARTGVRPPQTWDEYIAEALGYMGGQAPMPGGEVAGALSQLPRAAQWALKPVRAAYDWFSPTVTPSIGAYGAGSLIGAGINSGMSGVQRWLHPFEAGNEDIEGAVTRAKLESLSPRQRAALIDQGLSIPVTSPSIGDTNEAMLSQQKIPYEDPHVTALTSGLPRIDKEKFLDFPELDKEEHDENQEFADSF